jgi:hypothetical protein
MDRDSELSGNFPLGILAAASPARARLGGPTAGRALDRGDTVATAREPSPGTHRFLERPLSDIQTCFQAVLVRRSEVNTAVQSAERCLTRGLLKASKASRLFGALRCAGKPNVWRSIEKRQDRGSSAAEGTVA